MASELKILPQDKDPVCGMPVSPETSKHSYRHGGKTFFFCCAGCLEKFKSDPGAYLKGSPQKGSHQAAASSLVTPGPPLATAAESISYVCPMCPDVRSPHPAPCPKCGMALEPET